MENKKTAVDWLIDQLRVLAHNPKTHLGMGDVRLTQGYIDELVQQAKQMEKEQIISAYMVCDDCGTLEESEKYAEQYYNETYGK